MTPENQESKPREDNKEKSDVSDTMGLNPQKDLDSIEKMFNYDSRPRKKSKKNKN